jgi:hypothetical protein
MKTQVRCRAGMELEISRNEGKTNQHIPMLGRSSERDTGAFRINWSIMQLTL